MQRNPMIALAALIGSSVIAAMACFPDVTFSAGSGGTQSSSGTGMPTPGSSGTATTASAGGTGGHTTTTSTAVSSSTSTSGTGCPSGKPCDCDGDNDNAHTPECNYDGGDCNDHDPLVSSKQTMFFTQPGSHGWDYNCDGIITPEYPDPINCLMCKSTYQWTGLGGVPGCGDAGTYGLCEAGVIGCFEKDEPGVLIQGCH
jgi:hypothetical protein